MEIPLDLANKDLEKKAKMMMIFTTIQDIRDSKMEWG
jgi:hypothetical protein